MKLVRLTILEKFRSLDEVKTDQGKEDFTVIFRDDEPNEEWINFHPYCFAGLNGSGKSNVLEALSNIFYHLECCTLDPETSEFLKNDFKKEESDPIAYELEYFIIPREADKKVENYHNIIIRKEKDKIPQIKVKALDQSNKPEFIDISGSIRSYLPELVIGYSSGENEILSLPFIKSRLLQLDEYIYHLRNRSKLVLDYKIEKKPESSLVYMDYHMSQAILLANFLLQNDDIIEPIKEQLSIDKLHSFRLVINNHKLYYDDEDPELGYLLPLVEETLDKLRRCATAKFTQPAADERKYEYEVLDFYFDENKQTKESALKSAFKKYFESPLQLFKAFQVLNLLNLRIVDNDLKKEVYNSDSLYAMYKIPAFKEQEHIFHFNLFRLKKKNSEDKMLLKAFSDGEHQFLHTMGICLLLGDKSTLMLLDEPETHFNPEWRSEFISLLKDCLNKSGTNHLMRDILVTSHSPFIISDCFPDKVIVFERNKQPRSAFNMNFRTFGTSVDIIMENVFNRGNTIGDLSASVITEIEEEIKNKKKLTSEQVISYKNRTNHLGDSIEKILLFTKLNELKKK
ncbi:restriction system-associated AAA family ATPase [Chryseobacterium cucumeris]|uniref:restriction system-associated AAA family ATPase n=1 Tax=Chryseobacterium cucumeris TaxID=1813611 RepID=UPI002457B7FB|nr:restriction system-associated AAA family ATPase [Chryseobacterium cucumeris]MDH5033775.1 restriction system-associated AAA family ATPase [Chryseobacterium cucumeris]